MEQKTGQSPEAENRPWVWNPELSVTRCSRKSLVAWFCSPGLAHLRMPANPQTLRVCGPAGLQTLTIPASPAVLSVVGKAPSRLLDSLEPQMWVARTPSGMVPV
eukprot:TRINITY_DN1919_c0_g1_i1.p2 TRINITY_DN1919_c0_g1~~TRINITY_DN1919_c0_g1_i1.p2  ORF type:complete len:104 (-),score=5.75 TRINITY_DN1919_c0_g1_i1:667-978(-)